MIGDLPKAEGNIKLVCKPLTNRNILQKPSLILIIALSFT
jgi:hypothetical protein